MGRTPTANVVVVVRTAAGLVLTREGFEGVTVRSVAAEAGVSPQVIYNRFGSLDGLLDDLATAGFRRLAQWLLGAGSRPCSADRPLGSITDPLLVVIEAFRRYQRFAVAEPELYRFLFEGFGRNFTPSPRTVRSRQETFDIFVAAMTSATDAGVILPGSPAGLANRLLASAYGTIRLEQIGLPLGDDGRSAFDATLATMIRGLRPSAQLR